MAEVFKNFYFINGAVIFFLIVYLLWKSPKQGVRLRMKQGKATPKNKLISGEVSQPLSKADHQGPYGVVRPESQGTLNVMFNWNGHTWDAYEVLGLPAGSSMVAVEKAYSEQMKKMDSDSQAFIKMAYQSICRHCGHKSSKSH